MNTLDHLEIRNFKSIHSLNFDLKSLNIFIGANGVGKSNFVGIFKFLNQVIKGNLQNFTAASGGADSILYFGRKTSEEMSFKLSFKGGVNGYECSFSPTPEDNFYFSNENILIHDKKKYPKPYNEYIGSGHLESEIPGSKKRVARYVSEYLDSWRLYHFHDTSESAKVKQTCNIADNKTLQHDARNLAAFLYLLEKKHPDRFENIQDAVRMVAPFFDRFNLHPSQLNEDKILLEWKEKGCDDYFNASALSDGTLRFICLATLLLQPESKLPSIILLDEPELGLHPYAIAVLAGLLRSTSKCAQIIVATQSVTLVNQFEPDDIVVVDREKGQSVFCRLDRPDMTDCLEEYGLGDLWEKNILGGRP
ncbi:MAG: AAA family ATPase [Candidatus Scalindua sp.]|nr:AAA family ATPase [Candidatus Scalindua sp.]